MHAASREYNNVIAMMGRLKMKKHKLNEQSESIIRNYSVVDIPYVY